MTQAYSPIPAATIDTVQGYSNTKQRTGKDMDYSSQQEMDTIKTRTIALRLSDTDAVRITEKAEGVGLSVSELLELFIADLIDGANTNGADERMLANEWFNRCDFSQVHDKTFLTTLIGWGCIEQALDTLDDIADAEEDLQRATDDDERAIIGEDIYYHQKELEDYYREYVDSWTGKPQTYTDAIESVKQYKERLEALKNGR